MSFTPFYKTELWVDRLANGGFSSLSREHKREFTDASWDDHLRLNYELAFESYSIDDGKDWGELTEDEKENVNKSVRQYAAEMHEFGKTLGEVK